MNSLILIGEILKAKREALRKYHVAVTRRLDRLKGINREPDVWRCTDKLESGIFVFQSNPPKGGIISIPIKPRYHVGQVVYIREAWASNAVWEVIYRSDFSPSQVRPYFGYGLVWKSPYAMSEKLARQFVQFTDVRPERLDLAKISQHEIELEGGEPAIKFLQKYHGLWVFRNEFKEVKRP